MSEPIQIRCLGASPGRFLSTLALTLGLACVTTPHLVHSEDLGRYGNLWDIEEQDGVEQMLDKLRQMEKDGRLDTLQEKYKQDFINRMENPAPIAGLSNATEARTYKVDPSIVVEEPILNDKGAIIVPPGTRINPLDYTSWSKSVVLIDARVPEQVDFVKNRLAEHPNDKIILVGGSYLKLMRELHVRVYYDLNGAFTTRFGLTKVPAVVSQTGKTLLVQEIVLGDNHQ